MTWPAWVVVGLTVWACLDFALAAAVGRLLARSARRYPRVPS